MITTTDVANILVRDCKAFGIEVLQKGNIPECEITKERIIIHVKKQSTETYWKKCFVDVNFCAPDKYNEADLALLNNLEHNALDNLESVGVYNSSHYRYSVYSHGLESDSSMKCHLINVKLLFEVLNVN